MHRHLLLYIKPHGNQDIVALGVGISYLKTDLDCVLRVKCSVDVKTVISLMLFRMWISSLDYAGQLLLFSVSPSSQTDKGIVTYNANRLPLGMLNFRFM